MIKDYIATIRIQADSESDIDTIWSNIEYDLTDVRAGYSVEIVQAKEV